MVFSSLTFVFFFLPAVFLLYFPVRNRTWRNGVLLAASLVFYSWGEPRHIILMLASTAVAYLGGIGMSETEIKGQKKLNTVIYVVTLVLLTSSLFVFKYLNLVVSTAESLTGTEYGFKRIALPIGISFYTFQILSYVIDLHRGKVTLQRNPLRLLLYVSFFPQLIAGPIVRYQTVENEITERKESVSDIEYGLKRFIIGLAKKVLLANNISAYMNIIYGMEPDKCGTAILWIAAAAYTVQIYYDFSGYSDMAIGLGRIFGFHFLENFDYPYYTFSITEYWRKWHISLSSWFRDYIYIPLGGNRVGKARWVLNILIVWALTGLWHGAEWNFPLWGIYYGVILVAEKLFLGKLLERLPKPVRWLYMFTMITIGFVLFNITDPEKYLDVMRRMFAFAPTDWHGVISSSINIVKTSIWMPLGLLFIFPVKRIIRTGGDSALFKAAEYAFYLALFVLCIIYMLSTTYNPFIYFRF